MGQIIDITTGNPLDDERSNKPNMPICVEDAEFEYLDDEERDLIEAIESEGDWRPTKNMHEEIERLIALAQKTGTYDIGGGKILPFTQS